MQRGLGQMASDLLLKGTRSQDAYALADARDALGAAIWTEHAQDETVVAMTALKSQLQGSLALYADIVRNPAFPADMIEVQRKQQLAGIDQQRANPTAWRCARRCRCCSAPVIPMHKRAVSAIPSRWLRSTAMH
jgi:predicted Zn-dependent peptidase